MFKEMRKPEPLSISGKGEAEAIKADGIYEKMIIPFDDILGTAEDTQAAEAPAARLRSNDP